MEPFFSVRQDRGYSVVEFQTESLMNPLDLERIGQSLYQLVDAAGVRRMLLDFTRVKYLSSQAIGIILTLSKKLSQANGGEMVLCGVGPQLLQLLKITRLDKLLKIVTSQKDVEPAKV